MASADVFLAAKSSEVSRPRRLGSFPRNVSFRLPILSASPQGGGGVNGFPGTPRHSQQNTSTLEDTLTLLLSATDP